MALSDKPMNPGYVVLEDTTPDGSTLTVACSIKDAGKAAAWHAIKGLKAVAEELGFIFKGESTAFAKFEKPDVDSHSDELAALQTAITQAGHDFYLTRADVKQSEIAA